MSHLPVPVHVNQCFALMFSTKFQAIFGMATFVAALNFDARMLEDV